MKVGELIDLLHSFRGRGDDVMVYNNSLGENLLITGIEWDERDKCVCINADLHRPFHMGEL